MQINRRSRQAFSNVVGTIYDAAIRPELLQDAMAQIASYFEASVCGTNLIDISNGDVPLAVGIGLEPEFQKSLQTTYGFMWANFTGIMSFPVGEPMRLEDVASDKELLSSRFYKEWLLPQQQRWWIGALVMRHGTRAAVFSLGRRDDEAPFSNEDVDDLRLIMPHIGRAFAIADILSIIPNKNVAFEAIIDNLTEAVFLCGVEGNIIHCNKSAHALLATNGGPFFSANGRLVASSKNAANALNTIFMQPTYFEEYKSAHESSFSVPYANGIDHSIATVLPIDRGERERMLRPFSAQFAVFVQPLRASFDLPWETLGKQYGLTAAEIRVLSSTATGNGVPETAANLGLKQTTVRSHLKSLFAKTGTRKQAQLTALIASSASPLN